MPPLLTKKQWIVIAVASGLVVLMFWSSLSRKMALPEAQAASGVAIFISASIDTVLRFFTTVGGLVCVVILAGLFFRFRQPRDGGTEEDGYELLTQATRLEREGRIQEALAAYRHVAEKYSHTPAGQDAQISIESLQAKAD